MGEISREIKERIGLISQNEKTGWTKELNLVSWNGDPAKYDVREWDKEHEKVSKGITLSLTEAATLLELLQGERYKNGI